MLYDSTAVLFAALDVNGIVVGLVDDGEQMLFPEIIINFVIFTPDVEVSTIIIEELQMFVGHILAQRLADVYLQVVFGHDLHIRRNANEIPIALDEVQSHSVYGANGGRIQFCSDSRM